MRRLDVRTSVTCRILVRVNVTGGDGSPTLVDLRYDSTDPYAVSMNFHPVPEASVRWFVSRDLLLDGRHELTGAGDVQVWPSPDPHLGKVCIALGAGGSHEAVIVTASERSLDTFLRRTLAVVPAGTEGRHLDVDGTVHRLLNGPW